MLKGVDVSRWQDTVDWHRMKNEGIDFAIIRAGYGSPEPGEPLSKYIDNKFYQNRDSLRSLGMLRGFYWFTYPTVNEPEEEANAFADTVLPLQDGEVLALDIEGNIGPDPVGWSLRFLNKVTERTGVKPIIYINQSMNNSYDWSPVVDAGYGVWLAGWDYVADPQNEVSDWPFVAFEQYSNKGNVGGENPVDLDSFNGSAEQFLKYGYHAPVVEPPAPPTDPHEAQIAELNATIARLNNQISELSATNARYLEMQADLNRQIDEKTAKITELEKATGDSEDQHLEDLNEQKIQHAEEVAKLEAQIEKLKKQSIIFLANKAAEWLSKNFKKLYNRN